MHLTASLKFGKVVRIVQPPVESGYYFYSNSNCCLHDCTHDNTVKLCIPSVLDTLVCLQLPKIMLVGAGIIIIYS